MGQFANGFQIIGELPHVWPTNCNSRQAMYYSFLTPESTIIVSAYTLILNFKHMKSYENSYIDPSLRQCCLRWINWLQYCAVTQLGIVTSRWPIVFWTFLRTGKLVVRFAVVKVFMHSLIIESDSRHFTGKLLRNSTPNNFTCGSRIFASCCGCEMT